MRHATTVRDVVTYVYQEYAVATHDVAERFALPIADATRALVHIADDLKLLKRSSDRWRCYSPRAFAELDDILLDAASRGVQLNELLMASIEPPALAVAEEQQDAFLEGILKKMPQSQRKAVLVVVDASRDGRTIVLVHPSKVDSVPGAANVAALQAIERRGLVQFDKLSSREWKVGCLPQITYLVANAIQKSDE